MDFIWEDAGISLHFPAVHTNVGEIKISVAVVANVDEDSILPPKYRLMPATSATYKITASAILPAPIRVRMEHCALVDKEDSMTLMVAHKGPPFCFKPLRLGNISSYYGEIETMRFSLFRYFWNFLGRPMRLSIQVFYHEDSTATFVVTKNLKAHITAVRESVRESMKYLCVDNIPLSCESTTNDISLSLPADQDGWHITPTFEPAKIETVHINTYEPGQVVPNIKLCMEWKGSGHPKEKNVKIPITGGSIISFYLRCKPSPQELSKHQLPVTTIVPGTSDVQPHFSDRPTLPQLQIFRLQSGDSLNIIQLIGTKSHGLGIRLLNDNTGAITNSIEAEYRPDQTRITEAILQKWLEGTGRKPQTWATLITVLREIELSVLAKDIEDSLLPTHAQSQPIQTPHQDRATQQQAQDQRAPTEKKTPDQKQPTKEQNLVGCRRLLLWSVPLCVLIVAVLLNRLLF